MSHLLKYPIGEFEKPNTISPDLLQAWITDITTFPNKVERLTESLSTTQLNWKYRPNGWTIKQVVHHCADSHMNSLLRFKLALTEDQPAIRPYWEDRWAELSDSLEEDLTDVLYLIKGLHGKWVKLLNSLTPEQLKRTFIHPEHGTTFSLDENIGIYAWHCNHHLAHIHMALKCKGQV